MNSLGRICTLAAALAMAACSKAPETTATDTAGSSQGTKMYVVQGILRAINFAQGSVTVEHEEIPGYIPAMTMPSDVKTMSGVEPLKAGTLSRLRWS